MLCSNPYTLPEITFVGGETQEIPFDLYLSHQNPYDDTNNCEIVFSVVHYQKRDYGRPDISLDSASEQIEILKGEEGRSNRVVVTLKPEDTVDLYGKYIYQIMITDRMGVREIPRQGLMWIIRNIDPTRVKN